ncbi:MAG: hypothetical protein WAO91_03880 [Candidatus Nitrosotenuis sp.]
MSQSSFAGVNGVAFFEKMWAAFKRSEESLDLEKAAEDPLERQKEEAREKIATIRPTSSQEC